MCDSNKSCTSCNLTKRSRKSSKIGNIMPRKMKFNSDNIVSLATKGLMTGLGFLAANQVAGRLLPSGVLPQVGGKFAAGAATAFLLGQPLIGLGMVTDGFISGARASGIISGTPRRRTVAAGTAQGQVINGTPKAATTVAQTIPVRYRAR